MGNCTSHGTGYSMRTAKLILLDGKLEEFSYPEKVSNLMKRNADCFICNAEEMEFDGLIRGVDSDEELQPGQLYFELPLDYLMKKRRFQAEDMASLAVKASVALSTRNEQQMMKYYGCYYRPKRVVQDPVLVYFHEENVKVKPTSPAAGNGQADYCDLRFIKGRIPASSAAGVGNSKVSKFTATLSVILEAEE
ncbi:hypothetical protein ACH5RR_002296 [Cinchona calisaya]|uniref:Uncharacterized protein n=1 Tax=Cinchona calisaya TaxID=153742 RepID=A0ABD3B5W2_9GENT